MRIEYTRLQSVFAGIIQELEAELKRMKDNERIPQDVIDRKDLQIENLIKFNNAIDDLFNLYKLTNINITLELHATHDMLWQALKSEKTAFEVLMHKLVTTPKPHSANLHGKD